MFLLFFQRTSHCFVKDFNSFTRKWITLCRVWFNTSLSLSLSFSLSLSLEIDWVCSKCAIFFTLSTIVSFVMSFKSTKIFETINSKKQIYNLFLIFLSSILYKNNEHYNNSLFYLLDLKVRFQKKNKVQFVL